MGQRRGLRPALSPPGGAQEARLRAGSTGWHGFPSFRTRFDRILLDAPCSGTGTLARNPEIKWRLRPEDLGGLHRLQVGLLARAMEALAPDGRLVYSTCSLEEEENEAVLVEALGCVPDKQVRRVPGLDAGTGSMPL